jgi:hypothetical protein
MFTSLHFHTGGVAAVTGGRFSRDRVAAPHTPKSNIESAVLLHFALLYFDCGVNNGTIY